MPPPDDRPDRGGHRRWPLVLALAAAIVLTGLVAALVVVGVRTSARPEAGATATGSPTGTGAPAPTPASMKPTVAATTTPTGSASPGVTPGETAASTGTDAPTAAPQDPLPNPSGAPDLPAGPDRSLRTNSLYRIDLARTTGSCGLEVRRPKPPLADRALQPYLTEVVECLTETFRQPLAERGFILLEPTVRTYHRKAESPCGDFDQQGSPAYYCSTTRTIYWPDTVDDGREAYTFARLGYVGLTAHEFGHHLQASTGMLTAYADAYADVSTKDRYALSRRLELQAQCFEGVFLHVERKELAVSDQDRAELKAWHGYTGDEDPPAGRKPDHGTSAAQYAWLVRGLDSGDFADCDTWTASARSVT